MEVGVVFYNSMLDDLVPRQYLGRVSGWGWGIGYAGGLAYFYQVNDQDQLMIITGHGKIIRLRAAEISVIGRNTQGVKLIDLGEGEKVVGVAKVIDE